ncbi:hypothetical protein ZIOFF_073251 [Zingiber officinale]|uniref:Uncharacterized protein n=1 Tax=Zingiber officinale TaxID=94328 RepID=A0A8J5BYB5_ZINOF|nr:hypothetical protein ZIOFF_073251 [Zingiber officinale]
MAQSRLRGRERWLNLASATFSLALLLAKDSSARPPSPSSRCRCPRLRRLLGIALLLAITTLAQEDSSATSLGEMELGFSSLSCRSHPRVPVPLLPQLSSSRSSLQRSSQQSASKHSTSLGFFKLALEPLDQVLKELKSYVQRHGLVTEREESVKDLLHCYTVMEELEKLKVFETSPKVSEMVTQKSDKSKSSPGSKSRNRNVASKNPHF